MKIDKEYRIKLAKARDTAWQNAKVAFKKEWEQAKLKGINFTFSGSQDGKTMVTAISIPRKNAKPSIITCVADQLSKYEHDFLAKMLAKSANRIVSEVLAGKVLDNE